MTLAVVIPTLNEEAALPGLFASLRGQSRPAERIVVADAGSTDATVSVARQGGAEVLLATTKSGRGGQIAAAVASLTEEIVLVAHADMLLPLEALERVREALRNCRAAPAAAWGIASSAGRWSCGRSSGGDTPRPAGRVLWRSGPVFLPRTASASRRLPRSADHGGCR